MSMTTFYTQASTAAELAEALLLTATPSLSTTSSSGSSVDEDMMMLDFDVDVDSPLASPSSSPSPSCLAYVTDADGHVRPGHHLHHRRHFWSNQLQPSLDLITGDSAAMSSAVFCFVKNFVCASGSSTVAIDNKIEQAMDLVKSHLMFAVREEVEVLKERIAELMDRITYLESENAILRSAATQDTLAQIAQLETTFLAGSGSDNNNSSGAAGLAAISGVSAVTNAPPTATASSTTNSTSTTNGTSPAP